MKTKINNFKEWLIDEINQKKFDKYFWAIFIPTMVILYWTLPWIFPIVTRRDYVEYIAYATMTTCGTVSHYFSFKKNPFQMTPIFKMTFVMYSVVSLYLGSTFQGITLLLIFGVLYLFAIYTWWKRKEGKGNYQRQEMVTRKMEDRQKYIHIPLFLIVSTAFFLILNISLNIKYIKTGNTNFIWWVYKIVDSLAGGFTLVCFWLIHRRYREAAAVWIVLLMIMGVVWILYINTRYQQGLDPDASSIISLLTTFGYGIPAIYSRKLRKYKDSMMTFDEK